MKKLLISILLMAFTLGSCTKHRMVFPNKKDMPSKRVSKSTYN